MNNFSIYIYVLISCHNFFASLLKTFPGIYIYPVEKFCSNPNPTLTVHIYNSGLEPLG